MAIDLSALHTYYLKILEEPLEPKFEHNTDVMKSQRKFDMILSALDTVKQELRKKYAEIFISNTRIKQHKLLEVKHINNIIKSLDALEILKDEEKVIRSEIESTLDQTKYLSLLKSLRDTNHESDRWIDAHRLVSFPNANYNNIYNLKTEVKQFKKDLGYE